MEFRRVLFRSLLQALERRFVVALEVGFGTGLVLALRIQEHDLAAQLALVLLDVGLALDSDRDRLALDRAVGTWRPGLGPGEQRQRARRQPFALGLADPPAAASTRHVLSWTVTPAPPPHLPPPP